MYTKKLFFVLCLLATSFIGHSQTLEKRTWLVGGNFSYLNSSGNSGIFYGSLSGLNMVSKNVAIGGNLTYISSGSNLNIGPQARYYFNGEKTSKLFFLGGLSIRTEGGDPNYSLGAGLANFISDYVSVDFVGTYGNFFSTSNGLSSYRSDLIGIQVGLQIYLPKKK